MVPNDVVSHLHKNDVTIFNKNINDKVFKIHHSANWAQSTKIWPDTWFIWRYLLILGQIRSFFVHLVPNDVVSHLHKIWPHHRSKNWRQSLFDSSSLDLGSIYENMTNHVIYLTVIIHFGLTQILNMCPMTYLICIKMTSPSLKY